MASPTFSGPPDFFSTLSTGDLQRTLRKGKTRPLSWLLNTDSAAVDFDGKRIYRDCFWKGSFAKDTLLGWSEQVAGFGSLGQASQIFAGGSFWKRFDRIERGAARGHVVNYEVQSLPGDPEVRRVPYPKSDRAYFEQGDDILLLTYRNAPYRIVYDTIKVLEDDSAIGVMHLGSFPNGLEFATFVMERHNYPFSKMTVDDYRLLSLTGKLSPASPDSLAGEWEGALLSNQDPNRVLLGLANPHRIDLRITQGPDGLKLEYRFGIFSTAKVFEQTHHFSQEPGAEEATFYTTPAGTLVGRVVTSEQKLALLPGMHLYVDPAGEGLAFYFVAERKGA